jgi:amino acid adenylation domain-containing protein
MGHVNNIEDIYNLSPLQQGLLFHTLHAPESGVYFEQFSWVLGGDLEIGSFEWAWQQVLERHPSLRTAFYWEELSEPLQVVHRQVELPWVEEDWRGLSPSEQQGRFEAFLEVDRVRGFELGQAPLMRCALLRVAEDAYQFVWSHHHLLLDGWSLPLVLKEVLAYYEAYCGGRELRLERPRPYRDYIVWLQQQDLAQAERFWREALRGLTAPTPLPIGRSEGVGLERQPCYAERGLRVSAAVTGRLQALAREHRLTLNTLVQGAWALLLSRYSGEEEVLFGATVSGRPAELGGVEAMVGLFINTLPVRVEVPPQARLLPWLEQLQGQQVEREQYAYSPLVQIQGWSEVPRGVPLFESLVVFENYPVDASLTEQSKAVEVREVRAVERTNYPLTVVAAILGSELVFKVIYDGDRFEAATIERLGEHLQCLLRGMVAAPAQWLGELPLLSEAERQQVVVEWNATEAAYPQGRCIHELFEAQVEQTPEAVAVVYEDRWLSYRALNARANQLAHTLQALGVGPERLVGVCLERSLELVVGLLGILKAGGAYVPLDPTYPPERLAFMLEDARVPVLLTQEGLAPTLPSTPTQLLCLDSAWGKIALASAANPMGAVSPENLAYVIYTSGSTGRPKGVQVSHQSLVNFLHFIRQQLGLIAQDIFLAVTTLSFDIAALELYLPLVVGAQIVLVSREAAVDGSQLLEKLNYTGATVMQATPATWHLLLAAGWEDSQQLKILCGGEALPRELAHQLLGKGTSVWNLYGPTETTIWSTARQVSSHPITSIQDASESIGRPIANTQVYLLDRELRPVPLGVPGELHLGGIGLARGYLTRSELTAERFIPHPFSEVPGKRLYRTGDVARYLPDGNLEFLGRIDHQVKVRGLRIELGEIEAVLGGHPGVQETCVVVREDHPGEKGLVGYYVAGAAVVEPEALRGYLRAKLPEYMVPAVFMRLAALPLTPNGKVDRKALPAPERGGAEGYEAPRTPTEELLAGIWAEVLHQERVGRHDNFFALGGHSLRAIQVVSRVRDTLGVELPVRGVFESPTLAELSAVIEGARQGPLPLPPIEPVAREGQLGLSFAQERLWFLDQLEGPSATYNIAAGLKLSGPLEVGALERSLKELVRRHEVLRTTFPTVEGVAVQVIAAEPGVSLPVVDLQGLSAEAQTVELGRLAAEEAGRPFDLARGPLLRVCLLRLGEAEHGLLLTLHHIVADGWSMGVFVREVSALYQAFSTGRPSPLAALPIQYADFAAWQREWLQGEVLNAQLGYWKKQLAGAPALLDLPTDRPRPAVQTFRGGVQYIQISPELTNELKVLSRQAGATLYMTLLGVFVTLLSRYSGQENIVVGTSIANRNRREMESLIGFAVNTLVMRTDLAGNPTFRQLLGRVRQVALDAFAHQDLPFEKLVEELQPERNPSYNPLFQVFFVLENAPVSKLELTGLTLSPMEMENAAAMFDLLLSMNETEAGLRGSLQYNSDLFDAATITCMGKRFQILVESIVRDPDTAITDLQIIDKAPELPSISPRVRQK